MPRADRLLRLVQVLRRYRQPVSAQQLADELEISIRSVYRDVQTLRTEGATIDGEPGVGYVLRPGFMLPPLMFTDEELEALLLGLRLTAEHADEALPACGDAERERDEPGHLGLRVTPDGLPDEHCACRCDAEGRHERGADQG